MSCTGCDGAAPRRLLLLGRRERAPDDVVGAGGSSACGGNAGLSVSMASPVASFLISGKSASLFGGLALYDAYGVQGFLLLSV